MRYIDADTLEAKMCGWGAPETYTIDEIREAIDMMPTAIVAAPDPEEAEEDCERQRGRWVYVRQCKCYSGKYVLPAFLFECSNCGAELIYTETREPLPEICTECEAVMLP